MIRRHNSEKDENGEVKRRPRAKSDDNIEDPTLQSTINVLPTPPPSPPPRQPRASEEGEDMTVESET